MFIYESIDDQDDSYQINDPQYHIVKEVKTLVKFNENKRFLIHDKINEKYGYFILEDFISHFPYDSREIVKNFRQENLSKANQIFPDYKFTSENYGI